MNEDRLRNKLGLICAAVGLLFVIGLFCYNGITIKRLQNEIEKYKNAPADTIVKWKYDTLYIDSPILIKKYEAEKELIMLELKKMKAKLLANKDTLYLHDTTEIDVILPRTYAVYGDSTYRAVVSGIEPRLDTMAVFPKTKIQYITKTVTKTVTKKTRWGLGVHIGGGLVKDKVRPYIGAGVSYNILSW